MPIIVDEIVISVEVTGQPAGGAGAAPPDEDIKQEVIRQCVERVLEILQERERP